jgi:hypothetical protein
MMTTDTRRLLEFGYTKLAGLSDDAVKAQYEAAFDADPVNGFRFGHHIKNRAFAGKLFTKAASLAPASALEDFDSYAYVVPRKPLYEIKADSEFEKTMSAQIAEGVRGALAQAQRKGDLDYVSELQAKDQGQKLEEAKRLRAEYQAEQRLYPWARDVLMEAARRAPEMTLAFCEKQKKADIPWLIDISIVAEENLPVTRGQRGGVLRALAERREMDTRRGVGGR